MFHPQMTGADESSFHYSRLQDELLRSGGLVNSSDHQVRRNEGLRADESFPHTTDDTANEKNRGAEDDQDYSGQ